MTVNANLSPQSPFTVVRSNSVQDSTPSAAKAFETLSKPEQDLFQTLSDKQKNNLNTTLTIMLNDQPKEAATATAAEKQAALNANLSTLLEADVAFNTQLKGTQDKQKATEAMVKTIFANYLPHLVSTPEGRNYYQKADMQQTQKLKAQGNNASLNPTS